MIKQAGDLIAGLDLDDPSAVRKAVPYEGGFPPLGPPTPVAGKVHQRCAFSIQAAQMVLAGYAHDIDDVRIETVHIHSDIFINEENYQASFCFDLFCIGCKDSIGLLG